MEHDNPLAAEFGQYIWCELCGTVYTSAAWAANGNACPNCGATLVYAHPWEEIRREMLLVDLRQRIRDVRQGPDELLYLLTDEDSGAILRIEPAN